MASTTASAWRRQCGFSSGGTDDSRSRSRRQAQESRFGRAIERAGGRDFPFYDGQPIEVAWWAWVIIALACAVGFAALVLMPFPTNVGLLIPRILFPLIPMVVCILVRTKNLFVSTGAHILNDWWGFTPAIVLGASAAT